MPERRTAAAGLALAAALVVAGCGSDKPTPGHFVAVTTPTPSATPTPGARVRITAPRDGAHVAATSATVSALRARVAIRGRAGAGETVLVRSGCTGAGCRAVALAGTDGRWSARLRVEGRPDHHVVLRAGTPSAATQDRVRLTLTGRLASTPRPVASPAPVPQPTSAPAAPAPAPVGGAAVGARRVVLVGDSLAQGIAPLLPHLLPGWSIRTDAVIGRPLASGMQALSRFDLRSQPTVTAISLFTNDDPRNVGALEAAVASSVQQAGPRGCVVWATIVRPPLGGVSYAAANRALVRLATSGRYSGHLLVVPWAEQVAHHPGWVGSDGVHGTAAGYQARATLYADAIHACAG